MLDKLQRYLIPGLVIQAVIVGGTYATGREVTEFFLKIGPNSGLIGLLITMVCYSTCCMLVFELARRYQVLDYKSFCRIYMGRFWFLYEIGFLFGVMLTLSVIGAAASEFAYDMVGAPKLGSALMFMCLVAGLVYLGGDRLEKVMSLWSLFFYVVYILLAILTYQKFGGEIAEKLSGPPVKLGDVTVSALIYTGYSCSILPTLVFVAKHFRERKEALVAGAFAGPLVILPGLAIMVMLMPFYPAVIEQPLPISLVLDNTGNPIFVRCVQIAILGTLAATGAGLLHGVNERIANAMKVSQRTMPPALRPGLALAAMLFSVFLATEVGIVDLVAKGFRYGAMAFIVIIFLPLVTRGFWMIVSAQNPKGDDLAD